MDITPGSESLAQKHIRIHFPTFKHDHPPVVNVNEVTADKLTIGQKLADGLANGMGSWAFIISQAVFLALWITVNLVNIAGFGHFDAEPFILLNLILSFQAGFAAPVIMMSQNRQSQKDRITAQNDYVMDTKGEEEIRHIMNHLDHQDELILQLLKRIEDQHQVIMGHLPGLDPELAQKLGSEMGQVSTENL